MRTCPIGFMLDRRPRNADVVGDADGQDGGYPYRTVETTNGCAHRNW